MQPDHSSSFFLPKFLSSLSNPSIKTVFLTGCGGGFDFVHSMCLIPELKRQHKSFIIGSYSFGLPESIQAETIFSSTTSVPVIAKRVTAKSSCSSHYCPEVAICAFLDSEYPEDSPHSVYAYYARAFSVPILSDLHKLLIDLHNIDAVVMFDGGSDSLVRGNESGLGDPIEDAVSVAAVAGITDPRILFKALLCIGIGADRFNDVSDCSTLRNIAEITRLGGFLGAVSLEMGSAGYEFYKKCLEYIYTQQSFRSVLSGSILAAAQGHFGSEVVPELTGGRVQRGGLFVWPLMSMIWGFEPRVVADRSEIVWWIKECATAKECEEVFERNRMGMMGSGGVLEVEELPRHVDYCLRYCADDRVRIEDDRRKRKVRKQEQGKGKTKDTCEL